MLQKSSWKMLIRCAGIAECLRLFGDQSVPWTTSAFCFLFQHLHREATDHTFSQHLLKVECRTWKPLWPVKVLLSHLVHVTWDHFKHDPDFTLSLHIQVVANSGIQYCVGTLLRCFRYPHSSLSSHPPCLFGLQDTSELLNGVYNCLYVARASLNAKCHQQVFIWSVMLLPLRCNLTSVAVVRGVNVDRVSSLLRRKFLIEVKLEFFFWKNKAGCEINPKKSLAIKKNQLFFEGGRREGKEFTWPLLLANTDLQETKATYVLKQDN